MASTKDIKIIYVALTPIEHDGVCYAEGDEMNLSESVASALLAIGAISQQ